MKRSHLLVSLAGIGLFLAACSAQEPARPPSGNPNLLIDVSAQAVNAAVRREVDRLDLVDDVIQDTPIKGLSRTRGQVAAELVPCFDRAIVDLVFGGHAFAKTVGTRPLVSIHSSSSTVLGTRYRIQFDGHGIAPSPVNVYAKAAIQLTDITNSYGERDTLATNFARLSFQASKEDAEAESARKAAHQSARRMESELLPSLASASQTVRQGIVQLNRTGLVLDSLKFSTTHDALQARARIVLRQGGQPDQAPPALANADVNLRIHQSLINDFAQATLGGKSINLHEALEAFDGLTRDLLRDGRSAADQDVGRKNLQQLVASLAGKLTTISFAEQGPLVVAFSERGFVVELRVASLQQAGVVLPGMGVRAAYRLENDAKNVRLIRQGPVQFFAVKDAGAKNDSAPLAALRQALFGELLKESFTLGSLPLPDGLASLGLRGSHAETTDGWLSLAWVLNR